MVAPNGPEEPSADMRMLASTLREMYVALKLEGFSMYEAILLVGQVLAANQRPPESSGEGT